MLPDFPALKRRLERQLLYRLEQTRTKELGPFGGAPAFVLKEGNRLVFVTDTGEEREMEFKRAGAEVSIPISDAPALSLDQLVQKIDDAAREIAKQQHEHAITELTRAVDSVGNQLDAEGQPFSAEHVFRMLERISIDFTENREPQLPTMIVHPDQSSRVAEVLAEIQNEPTLRARYEQIISDKREEWRARESSRKLVG